MSNSTDKFDEFLHYFLIIGVIIFAIVAYFMHAASLPKYPSQYYPK